MEATCTPTLGCHQGAISVVHNVKKCVNIDNHSNNKNSTDSNEF